MYTQPKHKYTECGEIYITDATTKNGKKNITKNTSDIQ